VPNATAPIALSEDQETVVELKESETAAKKGGPRGSVKRAMQRRTTGTGPPGGRTAEAAGLTDGALTARGWKRAGDAAMVAALRDVPPWSGAE
jgi:hypothetical protein